MISIVFTQTNKVNGKTFREKKEILWIHLSIYKCLQETLSNFVAIEVEIRAIWEQSYRI